METVLSTREVLYSVFKFLDDKSNTSNARVCRKWSDPALDVLWHDVQDMYRLLSILAPLYRDRSNGTFRFLEKLQPEDWQRFNHYSHRVRSLSYQAAKGRTICQTVFGELARSRTSLTILPNMRSLDWEGPLEACTIFMHKNVKSLSIKLPQNRLDVSHFIADVGARMENLTRLDLYLYRAIDYYDVIRLLSRLHKLQRLKLPPFYFRPGIYMVASKMRDLERIELLWDRSLAIPQGTFNFDAQLQEGSFPSLNTLQFCAPFTLAAKFLDRPFAPTNLTTLSISSFPNFESPDHFLDLVTVVAGHCSQLISFTLTSHIDSEVLKDKPYQKENHIALDHLRPLLQCSHLTVLCIQHHYPLQLQPADIEEIAKAWPGLESIDLNHQPLFINQARLPLDVLLPFARHCPKLHTVGLLVDATTTSNLVLSSTSYPRFLSVFTLRVGASAIDDEISVARFLGQICPAGCVVDDIGTMWRASACAEGLDALQLRISKWETVKTWLPALVDFRKIGRGEAEGLR